MFPEEFYSTAKYHIEEYQIRFRMPLKGEYF